jgi:hypothetical protein
LALQCFGYTNAVMRPLHAFHAFAHGMLLCLDYS